MKIGLILIFSYLFLTTAELSNPICAELKDDLLPGLGRTEVRAYCAPCHSLAIVTQQRLSKKVWDEVLIWMVDEQDMPEVPVEERSIIIDYLAQWYGIEKPR